MLKKSMMVGGGLLLLLALVFGQDACSYVTTSVGRVGRTVKDNIPVEFEIDRARQEIARLEPEIRNNMRLIAKEEVSVEKLEREVRDFEQRLAKDQTEILRLKEDLDSGRSTFVYVGVNYTADEVEKDLRHRFAEYKTDEATAGALQKVLQARHAGLEAAREKLVEMQAAKRQLEVDVENLQARLKMIEVGKTSSEFKFDDSRLARTRELIDDISARLSTEERLLKVDHKLEPRITLEPTASHGSISEEVATYFGGQPEQAEVVSK